MKKITIFSLLFLALNAAATAQQKADIRTNQTKVADLLMKLPPQSTSELTAAMKELVTIGEPGYKIIASKIQAPGTDKDMAERFAISGLTKYLGKGNDRQAERKAAIALANALKANPNEEAKDFLLQELQYIAVDDIVPIVKTYLTNKRLADPAARVLVRVNTTNAANALLYALTNAKGSQQITIIEALGDMQYAPAAKKIQLLYPSLKDKNATKVALYSLARIGDAQSGGLLKTAALAVNFKSEETNAVNSYLRWLTTQNHKGNKALVEKEAGQLLNNGQLGGQFKSAVLTLLYQAAPANARQEVLSALRADDIRYKATAIGLLSQSYNNEVSNEIQEVVKRTTDPVQQANLLYVFGDQKDKNAVPLLKELLQSKNKEVQLAAIPALAKASPDDAINPLIDLIKSGDKETITAAKNGLLTIKSADVAGKAASAIDMSLGDARAAFVEIAAQRGADKYAKAIFEEAEKGEGVAQSAAIKSIPYVIESGDEKKIAILLNKTNNKEEIAALQKALSTSLQGKKEKTEQVTTLAQLMNAPNADKSKYYAVFAGIGGKEALGIMNDELKNGNQEQKGAAVMALSAWSDAAALDMLYNVAKDPANSTLKESALNNFIAGINRSRNTTDQKVLQLRNAMDLATTVNQKKQIITSVGRNSSLPALVFAGRYLDDAALQQTAVQAVMNIVLDNTNLFGPAVDLIVNKAVDLNKDGEAAYQKAAWIKQQAALPKEGGFVSMFNGKDLTGWKGLVENPVKRAKMTAAELAAAQQKADAQMRKDWRIENGLLVFEGEGYNNLVSQKDYKDFEMYVDWKMEPKGDGGVYLRGSPQVQTWDSTRRDVGAEVGSGGLYNNQKNRSTPLVFADNPINEWNTFRIKMVGDKVTVYLNGQLVTDRTTLENYWDRKIPIFDKGPIELQAHGTRLEFRDVYVREIPRAEPYQLSAQEKKEGFVPLFNGINMEGWIGNTAGYFAEDGMIVCDPSVKAPDNTTSNVYTDKEYSDFVMRFEFQLTPGANNGLGIRTPIEGDAAYVGMELQILDNEAPIYKDLHVYQYHGSVYGVIPAKMGFLKPVGEWNVQEVRAVGNHITVILNGETILDGDIAKASKNNTATADGKKHPGLLNKSGHIGFLGHGSPLKFRHLRIKDLSKK